jgi:hypothetical protein
LRADGVVPEPENTTIATFSRGTTPARLIKRRRATPPDSGGEFSFGGFAAFKVPTYLFQHTFQPVKHILIFKPNEPHIEPLEEVASALVSFDAGKTHMALSVQLNREPAFRAEEIDNKRADTVLPTEFLSVKLRLL